ncbi:MAG: DNA polymerase III subunit gamma/tau [bacterium]|nr:DNA polymerase III subunit gamma/tau [bacterium]
MTYQVLARKWRPQDFSSLIGQEPIVTALRNALTENRIAQAYLFSGIRGVGKTTAARVFAKALNCERGPGRADPCNECVNCREITAGSDLDVLEIDAATYSKVEQVRELTESLRYAATRDRYKVVVLDEIHRLSRQAFDALLKIVEEPPPHLVFIFATTENDAVPATVLSRCQEFQFRRVPSPVLAPHLRAMADAESIEVSDTALRLIARAGEGSVRDSVALLDQLATFSSGKISDQDAGNLLGGLDAAVFHRLLGGILGDEPTVITELVGEIEQNGWDPHNVYSQFLAYARDGLHLAMGGKPENVDLPREDADALAELVQPSGYENLLRLTHQLLASELTVRRSEFGMLALEIAWLRAAELPKLVRVEDLLSGRVKANLPAAAAVAPPPRPAAPAPAPQATLPAPDRQPSPATAPAPAPAEPSPKDSGAAAEQIPHFKELLSSRRRSLAAHFNNATKLVFEDGELLIYPQPGDTLLRNALKRKNNVDFLTQLLQEIWGEGTHYRICKSPVKAAEAEPTAGPPAAAEPAGRAPLREPPEPSPRDDPPKSVREHPTVQAVLEIFDGTIRNVRPGQA